MLFSFDKEKNAAGGTEVFFKHTYLLVEQTPGDGRGQGSLVYYNPWGREQSDTN